MISGKTDRNPIEQIIWEDELLTIIIRSELQPTQTTFFTPPEFKQQVGFIVYPKGGEISRHIHKNYVRHINGTSEVLIIKQGHCLIDLYSDDHILITTRELFTGDVIIMIGGGHGFLMLEDTIFLEVKQGPYIDIDEKERF